MIIAVAILLLNMSLEHHLYKSGSLHQAISPTLVYSLLKRQNEIKVQHSILCMVMKKLLWGKWKLEARKTENDQWVFEAMCTILVLFDSGIFV